MRHVSIQQGRRSGGLTLVEVMIGVAIVALLAALAAPNLHEMVIRHRLDTAANEFMTALSTARSEAIRRGTDVVLCRSPCGDVNEAQENWTPGWEAFVDRNGDHVRNADEETIMQGQRLSEPMTLYSVQTTIPALIFGPSGEARVGTAARYFAFCHGSKPATAAKQSRSRAVIITGGGTVRLAAIDANGRPLKPNNNPVLNCQFP